MSGVVIRLSNALTSDRSQHQKDLLVTTVTTQEEERKRIARDLHDDIAGDLSTLRMSINRLTRQLDNPEAFTMATQQNKAMLDGSIEKVRNIARDLMPPTLQKLGLAKSLKELGTRLESVSGIPINVVENGHHKDLSEKVSLGLYRVTQELLNNALKHSQAKNITISIKISPFHLVIEDDGIGFDVEQENKKSINGGGMGLKSIDSRLQMIGAKMEMESTPGKGTKAYISFIQSLTVSEL